MIHMPSLADIKKRLRSDDTRVVIFDVAGTLLDNNGNLINASETLATLKAIADKHVLVLFNDNSDCSPEKLFAALKQHNVAFCSDLYFDNAAVQPWLDAASQLVRNSFASTYSNGAGLQRKIGPLDNNQFVLSIHEPGRVLEGTEHHIRKPQTGIASVDSSWGKTFFIVEMINKLGLPLSSSVLSDDVPFPCQHIILCDDEQRNCVFARNAFGITTIHVSSVDALQAHNAAVAEFKRAEAELRHEFSLATLQKVFSQLPKIIKQLPGDKYETFSALYDDLKTAIELKLKDFADIDLAASFVFASKTKPNMANIIYVCDNYLKFLPPTAQTAKELSSLLRAKTLAGNAENEELDGSISRAAQQLYSAIKGHIKKRASGITEDAINAQILAGITALNGLGLAENQDSLAKLRQSLNINVEVVATPSVGSSNSALFNSDLYKRTAGMKGYSAPGAEPAGATPATPLVRPKKKDRSCVKSGTGGPCSVM